MSNKPTPPIPAVLTVTEACDLLAKRTGEHWTLAQLLHVCPVPSVWIDYDPDAPAEVFGDRWEGFCAPMIFANDVHRLLHADDVALTMTRTPDDRHIRIAGMRFPMDSLRFDREDVLAAVRDCGASIASPEGPTSQEGQERGLQGAGDGGDDREIAIALTNARVRHDDIQIEIDEASATLRQRRGSVTAATVMALLRARAGQPNSCISAIAGDGVVWIRGSNGSPEKLTMGALKGRITRDRKRTHKNR